MKQNDRKLALLRVAGGLILVLGGALTVALTLEKPGWGVLKEIGGAFIVAGAVAVFTEFAFGYWAPPKKPVLTRTDAGMRLVAMKRAKYGDYHTWLLCTDSQELFFAGRSVLHRMKKDFSDRGLPKVSAALAQQLHIGSTIHILFLDPTWDGIDQLAAQEGRVSAKAMYADLQTTWRIVGELWEEIERAQGFRGQIQVCVCRNSKHYAFHSIRRLSGEPLDGSRMLVGFYFAKKLGWETPVFEVTGSHAQAVFREHFDNLQASARLLLRYSNAGGVMEFDREFYQKVQQHLAAKVDRIS